MTTLTTPPVLSPASRFSRAALLGVLRRNGLLIFFAVLILVFAVMRPEFLSEANIRNILQASSIIGILACGQTIVLLMAGFDISIGRTAVIAGLVVMATAPLGPAAAILITLAITALIGLVNGSLIAKASVNPFVVTLGMFTILGSMALLINNGASISGAPTWLSGLTQGGLFGISSSFFWFAGIAILTHCLLAYTRFGRHVYAVGGNKEAARLSGIRADRVMITGYVLCSLLAAIAGILLTARLNTASPVALPGAELDAIAAVIIGGTRMTGGFGSIPRTIVGVLVLSSLSSGLVILGVESYWQGVVKGAIIIAAVAFDVLFRPRR
ncbi:ABC transporter permease [Microbacterium sp. HMH0099]|uniref:ABC transporter permease n=1 Tax=Microbacterium sp. HMH0099 TaxID=3414026 RepID=UPI003BF6CE4F